MKLTHEQLIAAALAAGHQRRAPNQRTYRLNSPEAYAALAVPEHRRARRLDWCERALCDDELDRLIVPWEMAPRIGGEVVEVLAAELAEALAKAQCEWRVLVGLGLIGGEGND
ncbi:hypothetical protein ABDK56_09295 [Sphingomonas sp. ASV193]|uniref:hypothetical protein n=1 Tax=Sphingomonas sp. ASV193 TaxID=3144405 RepID=UPI0032E90EFC